MQVENLPLELSSCVSLQLHGSVLLISRSYHLCVWPIRFYGPEASFTVSFHLFWKRGAALTLRLLNARPLVLLCCLYVPCTDIITVYYKRDTRGLLVFEEGGEDVTLKNHLMFSLFVIKKPLQQICDGEIHIAPVCTLFHQFSEFK